MLKLQSVVIAAGYAAIAGILYACYVRFIDPGSFDIDESIAILAMVVLGGTGNLRGSVAGVVVLVVLPELLRQLVGGVSVGNVRMLLYGLALVIMMRFRPSGIAGVYRLG